MAISENNNHPENVTDDVSKNSWGEWRLFVLNKINENNDNTRLLADSFVKKHDKFEDKLSEIQDKILDKLGRFESETILNTDLKINELRISVEGKVDVISSKLENKIYNVENDLGDRLTDIENNFAETNKKYSEEISKISQELAVLKTRFGIYIMIISSIAAFIMQFLSSAINFKVGK